MDRVVTLDGIALRAVRQELGLSEEKFVEMIGALSIKSLRRWEKGRVRILRSKYVRVLDGLKLRISAASEGYLLVSPIEHENASIANMGDAPATQFIVDDTTKGDGQTYLHLISLVKKMKKGDRVFIATSESPRPHTTNRTLDSRLAEFHQELIDRVRNHGVGYMRIVCLRDEIETENRRIGKQTRPHALIRRSMVPRSFDHDQVLERIQDGGNVALRAASAVFDSDILLIESLETNTHAAALTINPRDPDFDKTVKLGVIISYDAEAIGFVRDLFARIHNKSMPAVTRDDKTHR